VESISPEAIEKLRAHSWPGNVRELKNAIERALIVGSGPTVEPDDLLLLDAPGHEASSAASSVIEPLAKIEKRMIEKAMAQAGGNKKRAAELLGIPRASLYNKLREYGLEGK
jgi:DNA-binding NtrC family response regulator